MYGSELARTGPAALVIGGVTFTPLWQMAIGVGVVLVGAIGLRLSSRLPGAAGETVRAYR